MDASSPLPEPAAAAPTLPESLVLRPSILERLDFAAVFGREGPVELELGAGDGSFILRAAAAAPGRNWLAVERLLGRLRKIDRKGRRAGLANLRALRLEASYVLRWMVSPGSLAGLHVYFPDPWPKRRHWKRRLVNTEFTHWAAEALQTGGTVCVRTDDPPYFAQMTEVFDGNPRFARADEPPGLLEIITDFEEGFRREGRATHHAAWRRVG